ncbi:MAG: DUF4249 family protein [Bacteroidetes bacterium]|nr:DUF4249 family protein [Bacteroidota bacterium]
MKINPNISRNKHLLARAIIAGLILTGCLDDNQKPISDNFVVEAFLFTGEPVRNVKIKEIKPLIPEEEDTTERIIPDATVFLSEQDQQYVLTFDPATGKYIYPGNDIDISTGDVFRLEVKVGNRVATSETIVPDKPTGVELSENLMVIPHLTLSLGLRDQIISLFFNERITLKWDNPLEESYFVVIEKRETTLDPILPEQVPEEAKTLLASFRFISEPSQDSSFEIIGIALETYGRHVAKVYRVNKEYEDLFKNLEQDSRDLNEPPSNIVNAIGIFTAFALDSVFFEVNRE